MGLIYKSKNVTIAERDLVKRLTKQCLKEIVKSKWEITGPRSEKLTVAKVWDKLYLKIKCRSQSSYGGKNYMCIDVGQYRKGRTFQHEYARIKNDPIIGEGTFATPEDALMLIVAHEVAHLIHYNYFIHTRWLRDGDNTPHGKGWQKIYRILRREIVNKNMVRDVDPEKKVA
tara:strand:+ start:6560 stop:7075 length:516 start_codon:yes stop_codon:yes gene_type:complete